MFLFKYFRFILLTCVLLFPISMVQAGKSHCSGSNCSGPMTDLGSSIFLSTLASGAVLIMPIVFSKEAVDDSTKSSAESKVKRCEKPCCGQPLPEMEVQHIGYDEQNQRQVIFAVADNPQQSLTLLWLLPNEEKNKTWLDPAASFVLGQKVRFQPSTQFSGCLLQDTSGETLAFVPAANTIPSTYSETF